jgi:putative ATPase
MDLFGAGPGAERHDELAADAPLAERMRPRDLDEVEGQGEVVGEGKLLRDLIEQDALPSLILWGPPGSGKTTLAHVIAGRTGARYVPFSAVTSGVAEVRRIIAEARHEKRLRGARTILFVDEIHRFNKAQQDAFLPHVEAGTVVLIGATTENPSFEVNSALLSRCRVVTLAALDDEALGRILDRTLADTERGLGARKVTVEDDARRFLVASADGDARSLLNALEAAAGRPGPEVTIDLRTAEQAVQRRGLLYDKDGEEHFNLISALQKSIRSSDVQAALYWTARMVEAGEDPLYVARRLVRIASEDVGMADPRALSVALAAKDAVHFLGPPEGHLALAEAAVFLATAPKSNALETAWGRVLADVRETLTEPVPLHLRNAPTRLMKDLGYGKGYQYAHDFEGGIVDQEHLPERLVGRVWYEPGDAGAEREVRRRMEDRERRRE